MAYLRSKEIPALAYVDDSWLGNFNSTYGQSEREQWLAAAETIHVAMLALFLCGYFLSVKKCDLRPTRIQRYLGMLCTIAGNRHYSGQPAVLYAIPESIARLHPGAFRSVRKALGPFSIDLMASTASAQRIPRSSRTLPFFSQYDCAESLGVDVLAQDVSRLPGTGGQAFGYYFPSPNTVRHVVQHLAECHAHAVIVVPDTRACWYPLVQQAIVRSLQVAPKIMFGFFQWPYQDGTLREWRYPHGR